MIEVNKETFYKIFENVDPYKIDKKETYEITYFYNKELDQSGQIIYNYVSSKDGIFHLTDINN